LSEKYAFCETLSTMKIHEKQFILPMQRESFSPQLIPSRISEFAKE